MKTSEWGKGKSKELMDRKESSGKKEEGTKKCGSIKRKEIYQEDELGKKMLLLEES